MNRDTPTFRKFYKDHYEPEELADRQREHQYYRRTVARFCEFLEVSDAPLSVLTDDNEKAFFSWILSNGFSSGTAKSEKARLRAIWWHASRLGFVATAPRKIVYSVAQPFEPPDQQAQQQDIRTLREFYELVYAPLKLRGKSQSNKRQYIIQLDHFARFLGREPVFADLRDDVAAQFFASIMESGNSPATANKARNHLLALWRMAARKRYVEEFPDVPRISEPVRIPAGWTAEDLAKLWAALEATPGKVCGIPANRWWMALHHVLWWTGERIGAVRQLRWEHYDQSTGWLTVPAQFRKFGKADKITHLAPEAIEAIEAIRAPERQIIFPWEKNLSQLYRHYRRILRRAGLPTDRKSMFHRMRKSAASHFEAAGGNATELLGHSNRAVTRNYLDPRIIKPPQPAEMLFVPGVCS